MSRSSRLVPPRSLPPRIELSVGLDEADDDAALRALVAKRLGVAEEGLPPVQLVRRAIDARRHEVRFHLVVGLRDGETVPPSAPLREVSGRKVIIVGDGPAGLFCAYELARAGIASVVLDRGKQVQPRRHDLKGLNKRGTVDPESNYCFGEGGAGTYSDGKLYTRADKRGDVRDVIGVLAEHGAPDRIRVDARPHIGSNKLPKVVTAIRESLEKAGVEVRFGARVVDLLSKDRRVQGVRLSNGEVLEGEEVVLATGHSARDVFELLMRVGVTVEAKPFALGVRIEHPQPLIDALQYGRHKSHPKLPAAYYRIATTVEERGVFSFCMCPGGFIVPASTEPDGLVVNGMSLSRRDSPFANSGLVVSVELDDLGRAGLDGPLAGVELQRRVERAAMAAGGYTLRAPATRVSHFLEGRGSTDVPATSYIPGLVAGDVAEVLSASGLPLADRLRSALRHFGKRMRGYVTDEAVLVGVESRTSSPVRVVRHRDTLETPDLIGLYPAGEGPGHAGGIMSAAMDGVAVARAIIAKRMSRVA